MFTYSRPSSAAFIILLLDDVLAELDKTRQFLLLDAVGEKHQCLISATHLDAFEQDWNVDSQILKLDNLKLEQEVYYYT